MSFAVQRAFLLSSCLIALSCAADPSDFPELEDRSFPLTAFCSVEVIGKGVKDVENDYLPHVITCENGGADLQALKAQAIAARSYLYYKLETSGAINDGQSDQVYTCGAQPQAKHFQAVKETAGQVLRYQGQTVAAFYVAGSKQTPQACKGVNDVPTEKYVTYNEGLSGDSIYQTTLGWVNPKNYRNRGCLSQWGSRCLESSGRNALQILRFYYGEDIGVETAEGSCTSPPTPTLEAQFVGQGSDAAPDETGQAYYKVCAGAPVNFWFELRNTGTASWVDWGDNGNAIGQRVRLGVPEDQVDPFTQNSRISLNDATNPDVHPPSWDPPGPDCNDQAFCQRTVFSKDGGIHAIAPTISGIHKTTWRLLDEGRAWFGPEMYLSFRVENCEPEEVGGAGGSPQGGAGGSDAGAELGGSAGIPSGGTTSSGGTSSSGGTTPFGGASTAGEKSGQKAGETGEKSKEISHIFTQKESEESGGCALQPASHFSAKQQGGWLLLLGLGWRMRRDRRKKVS